jgi:carbonic anhydrase
VRERLMDDKKFVTSINCMDGRIQIPIINWMKEKYKADFVDIISDAGPNKILSEQKSDIIIQSIRKRVEISVNAHASKVIAISGHHDCAGNPTDKETQLKQIKESVEKIRSWGFNVQVIGLWIDDRCIVHEIV